MKFFSPERSRNQPKATRVCICSINQSNRSISVRFLFLFCSLVFISRSYKNHSKAAIVSVGALIHQWEHPGPIMMMTMIMTA